MTKFDEILAYYKYSNLIENKKVCEWLNKNYTFYYDNLEQVIIDSSFNSNSSYYKILLKNPDPFNKIKYISFVSLENYNGAKFNIQYQNDEFLNHDNITKLFEFFTNKSLNITCNNMSIFEKNDFNFLIDSGYYYFCSYDKYYHIAIGLDFHIFEYNIDKKCIADIQWLSNKVYNKTCKITKNLSENRDEFSCYN